MAGSKIGGLKAAQTNKQKHGADFYQLIGSKGGKAYDRTSSPPRGFAAMPREKRVAAGIKGGSNGRPYSVNPKQTVPVVTEKRPRITLFARAIALIRK